MKIIKSIILNRNFILVLAVILGILLGKYAEYTKPYTLYVLAVVMTFSTTGISTKALFPIRKIIRPMLIGAFYNYVIFGAILIASAWFLMPNKMLFYGFVVIAAAPPGVAVIPFSHILNGKTDYAILGTFGAFLASIPLAPIIVKLFANKTGVSSFQLLILMINLVIIPLIASRVLLYKPVFKYVEKVRGKVVDWGFAIIIFTAVGLNRQVFFSDISVLLKASLVLFISLFILGEGFMLLMKKVRGNTPLNITQNLLLTIKSSGFSVVTAMTLFGEEAAIPSAILAVFVLLYLLYLSFKQDIKQKLS